MQVKKYRAATTRAALEQVKQELGEDAFVLETKRVQTRGFLGLKSESQIEISAVSSPVFNSQKSSETPQNAISKLNLTDDTPATPKSDEKPSDEQKSLVKNLTERINLISDFNKTEKPLSVVPKFEAVEISNEAPRFVHPKKELLSQPSKPIFKELASHKEKGKTVFREVNNHQESFTQPLNEENTPLFKNAESSVQSISNRDLELLRAELREVKFSLGAFAYRQNIHFNHGMIDLDVNDEIYDSPFYESFIELSATGVNPEVSRKLIQKVIPDFKNDLVKEKDITRTALMHGLLEKVRFAADPLKKDIPAIMAVVGSTGVGKTTTIAKLAARLALQENRRVELVTLDTYRIAAVEQLKTYSEIIGAGCHVVYSTLELDAVLRRLPTDTTVLIDTTGKSPHDLADQFELCDYLSRRREIRKCLAVQAITNTLDALASIRKFEMYGVDCLAITKMDETTRPGAMFEVSAESRLPLVYFGIGQRVPEDLQIATPETFISCVLGEKDVRPLAKITF